MYTLEIPDLATLDQRPSWCNLHGRIDRSACAEIRISELRDIAGCKAWAITHRLVCHRTQIASPRTIPNFTKRPNGDGRVGVGWWLLDAHEFNAAACSRHPRGMAGDRRTMRAHVMRDQYNDPERAGKFAFRRPRNATGLPDLYEGLGGNPNRGAARTKRLGMYADWEQPLRLEMWQYPTRILPAYYFVCPGEWLASAAYQRQVEAIYEQHGVKPHVGRGFETGAWRAGCADDWRVKIQEALRDALLPPPSTRRAGRKDPKHDPGCPQRTRKLLIVQCTNAEFEDARRGEAWIASIPPQLQTRARPLVAKLLDRYGPIMQPRVLLCSRCIGVRYGNDPEGARQSYRRKVGKKDARPAKRKVTKSNNAKWAAEKRRKKKETKKAERQ